MARRMSQPRERINPPQRPLFRSGLLRPDLRDPFQDRIPLQATPPWRIAKSRDTVSDTFLYWFRVITKYE